MPIRPAKDWRCRSRCRTIGAHCSAAVRFGRTHMAAWSMEDKIRWGFAAATLALLLVLGATYVLLQDSLRANESDLAVETTTAATVQTTERQLHRTRILFAALAVAIMLLS